MTNSHDNTIYMVRVTQEHANGLNLPEHVDAYSLYGDYTPIRFSAAFPGHYAGLPHLQSRRL